MRRSKASVGRRRISRSSQRCIPPPACSPCADSPAHCIVDLKGKPIAWVPQARPADLGRYVMDGSVSMRQKIFSRSISNVPATGLRWCSTAVAALWGGGAGWPGFKTVMSNAGGGRFIAPDDDEIGRPWVGTNS